MVGKSIIALALMVALATPAAAQSGAITMTSKHSVAVTADRLEAAVKAEPGFVVFGRIDYQSVAASQGGKVRPSQLVLFGRGRAVQTLLSAAPTLGLDLPLKVLIWEAEDGTVRLTYNSAEFLKARHSVEGLDPVLKQLTERTGSFASRAAEERLAAGGYQPGRKDERGLVVLVTRGGSDVRCPR
jgi:uncharacterized protein (DUF302 family)